MDANTLLAIGAALLLAVLAEEKTERAGTKVATGVLIVVGVLIALGAYIAIQLADYGYDVFKLAGG